MNSPTPVKKYVTVTTIYRHKNVNLNRRSHMEFMPSWSVQRTESSTKTWLFPLQYAFWIETNQSREGSRTFDPFQLKALKEICSCQFIVKILSAFRSLFRNDFHYSGMDCIIGIKIPFLNWRLKSSNGRLIRSNECWLGCYLHKPKVHTRNTKPLAAVGFSWFDITGNFSQFWGSSDYSSHFYNSRLFLHG